MGCAGGGVTVQCWAEIDRRPTVLSSAEIDVSASAIVHAMVRANWWCGGVCYAMAAGGLRKVVAGELGGRWCRLWRLGLVVVGVSAWVSFSCVLGVTRGGPGSVYMKNWTQTKSNWILNTKNWTKLFHGHLNRFKPKPYSKTLKQKEEQCTFKKKRGGGDVLLLTSLIWWEAEEWRLRHQVDRRG